MFFKATHVTTFFAIQVRHVNVSWDTLTKKTHNAFRRLDQLAHSDPFSFLRSNMCEQITRIKILNKFVISYRNSSLIEVLLLLFIIFIIVIKGTTCHFNWIVAYLNQFQFLSCSHPSLSVT